MIKPLRRKINQTNTKRPLFARNRRESPSWRSFNIKKRRTAKNPLINVKTPKLVISDIRLWLAKITYKVLFALLIGGFFYFLFFSEWLQVHSITIEGNQNIDKKLILDSVEPFLHKKRLYLFPSNNYFWIPVSRIENEINSSFKRISKLEVERAFPGGIVIKVEEKKAVLIFCNNKGCVWVDEEGVSYNRSSHLETMTDNASQVIVQDQSNSEMEIGSSVTDPKYVEFANNLWKNFPGTTKKELAGLSTSIPSAQEIRAHAKDGFVVFFDINLPLERSLILLERVLNEEMKNKGEDVSCLEYVDLRLSDRIFYKLKDNCGSNAPNSNDNNQVETNNNDNKEAVNITKTNKPPVENDKKKDKKKKKR